jgi:small subunit ribosomal protein S3
MMIERKFIQESIKRVKTRDYVKKTLEKAGIVDVDIQRTTLNTRVGIIAERPGLVIGKRGEGIKDISEKIEKEIGIENPQIEVADVSRPNLEPSVIARTIKRMLERGTKGKKVIKTMVAKVMRSGATGVEIIIDGSPSRGNRSKKERFSAGYLKKAGDSVKLIREARDIAVMKQGVLGITVRIVPPEVSFPDKIVIKKEGGLAAVAAETVESGAEMDTATKAAAPETGMKEVAAEVKPQKAEKETAKEAIAEIAAENSKKTAKKAAPKSEEKKAAEKKSEEFKCSECGKIFKTEKGLKTHEKTHK